MYDQINSIMIKTSGTCNLNCSYCFEKNRLNGKYFSDYKALLKFLRKLPIGNKLIIKFIGGEPLCNIPAIIEAAKQLKKIERYKETQVIFGMTTNGIEVSSLLSLLHSHLLSPYQTRVSWDGIHSSYTRLGSYDNSHIQKIGNSEFGKDIVVRMALTKETIPYLSESFEYALENGCNCLEYYYLFDYPYYKNYKFITEAEEQFNRIADLYEKYKFLYVNWKPLQLSRFLTKRDFNNAIRCRHLGQHLHIDENGKLYPCGMFSNDSYYADNLFCIGDIYNGFDKSQLQKFADNYGNMIPCTNMNCQNTQCFECPALSYYKTNCLHKKLEQTCELKSIERRIFLSHFKSSEVNEDKIKQQFDYSHWFMSTQINENLPYSD